VHIETVPKKDTWKGRGRPRREIPAAVKALADRTYRTGHIQVLTIEPDEESELSELKTLLNSYASSRGLRMRFQREGDVLRFEMADVAKRKAKTA